MLLVVLLLVVLLLVLLVVLLVVVVVVVLVLVVVVKPVVLMTAAVGFAVCSWPRRAANARPVLLHRAQTRKHSNSLRGDRRFHL